MLPAGESAKWRNPAARPAGSKPSDEDRLAVTEAEERVERHHEAALGRAAAPRARDVLELGAQVAVDLARCEHARAVARPLETVHRLADLADRPTVERELLDVDQRLVAVVERVQAVRGVEGEPALRRAEDRDPPVACMCVRHETPQQRVEVVRRPDRVAGHDRDSTDDAVGEKRGSSSEKK